MYARYRTVSTSEAAVGPDDDDDDDLLDAADAYGPSDGAAGAALGDNVGTDTPLPPDPNDPSAGTEPLGSLPVSAPAGSKPNLFGRLFAGKNKPLRLDDDAEGDDGRVDADGDIELR